MKNKIMVLLLIIILMGLVYNLLNYNERLMEGSQVLKEMSATDREEELNDKIDELNNSATEYATYVQNCKAQIASVISEKGITTYETDSIDVVVENIKKLSNTEYTVIYRIVGQHGAHEGDAISWAIAPTDNLKKAVIKKTSSSGTAILQDYNPGVASGTHADVTISATETIIEDFTEYTSGAIALRIVFGGIGGNCYAQMECTYLI